MNVPVSLSKQIQEAAREYRRKYGWVVVPLFGYSKNPAATVIKENGQWLKKWKQLQQRPMTDEEFDRNFSRSGLTGLGVITGAISNILSIDADTYHKDGMEYSAHSNLQSKSASKGLHDMFLFNPEVPTTGLQKDVHIEIKSEGGFIVLPPSQTRMKDAEGKETDIIGKHEWIYKCDPKEIVSITRDEVKSYLKEADRSRSSKRKRIDLREKVNMKHGDQHNAFLDACNSMFAKYPEKDWNEAESILRSIANTYEDIDATHVDQTLKDCKNFIRRMREEKAARQTTCTDTANAERLAELYGHELRFDYKHKRWLVWDGNSWTPDTTGEVDRRIKSAARKLYSAASEIDELKTRQTVSNWAIQSEQASRIRATESLARSERPLADSGENWDTNRMLLGCKNGVLDLTTGKLRAGIPEERITLNTGFAYDPDAKSPLWEQFLEEIFQGDKELIRYMQKALGYSITGETKEHLVFVGYGNGRNGKGTLMTTIATVLGDYAQSTPSSTFKKQKQQSPTNDIARMENKRFLCASETLEAAQLDEEKIKALSGGDKISVRPLYQEFFEFYPHLKIWMFVNHKPLISDDSFAFWERVKLIPFNRQFTAEERDRDLLAKLQTESAGILRWLIEGCLLWQKEGLLDTPDVVNEATGEYQRESDWFADFTYTCCEVGDGKKVKAGDLFSAYRKWAIEEGYKESEIKSTTTFGRKVGEKFKKERTTAGNIYVGLCIVPSLVMYGLEGFGKSPSRESNRNTLSKTAPNYTSSLKNPTSTIHTEN